MNAYILGRHDGDLPTHLLSEGEPGHRVRAMAKLEGPEHNAYYALEAPTPEAMDNLTSSVVASGTVVNNTVGLCETVGCHQANDGVKHTPSLMPPFRNIRFELFHGLEDIIAGVHQAHGTLGLDNVAAGNDGKGSFLVQLGHDDKAVLDKAAADFARTVGGTSTGSHAVSSEGIQRAS